MVSKVDIAVQDILTQHKSTGEPADKLVGRLTRARGLGSRDRKLVADAVFEHLRAKPWPTWFTTKISPELEQALRTRAKPVLAIDARFMTAAEAQKQLQKLGIESKLSDLANTALILEQDRLNLDTLPKNLQEAVWFMDEGSQVIAQQIKAKPGETVLDLCAGSGGKTRMLLATGAKITAVDKSDKRLAKIPGVKRIVADGRTVSLPPFDWILIDAPCSGTGTLRRSPDIFGRLKETDINSYAMLQKELVANATKMLKPTGKLVYATCSVMPEENHVEFEGLELIENQQLLPSREGCDGFYWALLK